jgi:probable F420-dependent oxidoreductase
MPLSFGLWYDFRNPAPWRRPWQRLYQETLEQVAWADSLGFDSVWLSEHHFTDDGYLPALLPMLAALAMRTSRMRLGTAVLLAPLHHPLRLAEDAAVVDTLSGGRLELGMAPGYRAEEFALLGVRRAERGRRTDETIEILKAAWRARPFSYRGSCFRFEDVVVTPPPLQRPHPPIWVGGSSQAAARRAAHHGCHFLPDADAPAELYHLYRTDLAANGHDPARFRIATSRAVYVCDDPERGWREVQEHYQYMANRYRQWSAAGNTEHPQRPLKHADELSQGNYLVGTPDMVAQEISRLQRALPLDRLIFWARPPGLSVASSSRSLELFAQQVLPRFAS